MALAMVVSLGSNDQRGSSSTGTADVRLSKKLRRSDSVNTVFGAQVLATTSSEEEEQTVVCASGDMVAVCSETTRAVSDRRIGG